LNAIHTQRKMLKRCLILSFLLISLVAPAQGVLISNQVGVPDSSAILELADTTKGFLPPRLTTTQRNAIINPAEGLIIFNVDSKCFEGKTPSGWKYLACDCSSAPPTPTQVQLPSGFCPGTSGHGIVVAPVSGATSYTWQVPPGIQIDSGQGGSTLYVRILNSFTDTIKVRANNACGSSSFFNLLVSSGLPNPGFNPTTASVNLATTMLPLTQSGTHFWTFQNGSPATSTSPSPSVTWSQSGNVSVFHRITDANGCVDSLQQNLTVVNCLPLGNTAVDFNYSGNVQSWTVPAGVCSLQIECWGGQGGTATNNSGCILGGLGGYAKGNLAVSAGQTLYIYVGGAGGSGNTPGWNGGGSSCNFTTTCAAGGGGSDVRINGQTLNNRIIVAGGGGGAEWSGCAGIAGHGGGSNGNGGLHNGAYSGGGGSQNAGGIAGVAGYPGQPGSFGQGGAAGNHPAGHSGSGGGGWYGGGGSGEDGHGGGGSGYTGGVTNATMSNGLRSGNGLVRITY